MKMKMKSVLLAVAGMFAVSAYADVPYIFTAGEAAVADEVNDNFEYLDSRIDGAAGCNADFGAPTWTYVANNVSAGTTVNYSFNGSTHTFVQTRLAFVDPTTGTRYAISLPLDTHVSPYVSAVYLKKAQGGCFDGVSISGYPSEIKFMEYMTASATSSNANLKKTLALVAVNIKVGGVVASIQMNNLLYESSVNYTISNYDSVGYIPDSEFTLRHMAQFGFVDNWMDRVKIEVLP